MCIHSSRIQIYDQRNNMLVYLKVSSIFQYICINKNLLFFKINNIL